MRSEGRVDRGREGGREGGRDGRTCQGQPNSSSRILKAISLEKGGTASCSF